MTDPEAAAASTGVDAEISQGSQSERVVRNAGLFALGTFLSRITGFVRDATIVAVFGSAQTDIWLLAWTLPNAMRRLVGEGSLTVSFVPIFSGRLSEGKEAARRFSEQAFGAAALVLAVLSVCGVMLMPFIVRVLAGSWPLERQALAVQVGQLAFPYLWFIGLVALAMGVLNTLGRFFVPAVCQAFLNISLVLGALLASRLVTPGLLALALAALVGGSLQLGVNLLALRRAHFFPHPRLNFKDPHLRRLGVLMAPATLAASIHQVNLLLSRAFAAAGEPGSITWLYHANVLIELPLGLFAVSIAVASLPVLSRHAKAGDTVAFREALATSLRQVLFVTLPAAVGLAALALPTVAVAFQRGAFLSVDSQHTAAALVLYALGLPAIGCSRIVVQGFYALEDTRTPVLVGVVSVLSFVALTLSMMPSLGYRGIALAVAITAWINVAVNLGLLRRKAGKLGLRRVATTFTRSLLAAALTGLVAYEVSRLGAFQYGGGAQLGHTSLNVAVLALAIAAGVAVYGVASLAMGSEEAKAAWQRLRGRLLSTMR